MIQLHRPKLRYEAEFLAAARRSRKLHRHFAYPPATPDDFREYLRNARHASRDSHLVFEGDDLVGAANLGEIVHGALQSAYLGYYVFEPHQGRGVMTRAVALVLHRAFRELRLHRVESNIQPDNTASIALVKRLGFRKEGYSPRYLKLGGRWRDHERWAILREDWSG